MPNPTPEHEPEWQQFLKRFRIQDISHRAGDYDVISNSGKTYRVVSKMGVSRDSGSYYFTMSCNCPAWKRCRHIEAVEQMRYAEALVNHDSDMLEIIERTK
jgi:hypothetical protein